MFVNETDWLAAVLAPFGPVEDDGRPPEFEIRSPEDLDAAVAALAGTFRASLPESLCPDRETTVRVERLADFKPAGVLAGSPWLSRLAGALAFLEKASADGLSLKETADRLASDFGPLPLDLAAANQGPTPGQGRDQREAGVVDSILDMVTAPSETRPSGSRGPAAAWASDLRARLSGSLAAVYADPAFRAAEAAWRGVRLMLAGADRETPLRLRLFRTGAQGLPAALTALAADADAAPPNLILADVALDAAPARLEIWKALADAAATLLAPAVAGLAPAFFHLDDWDELSRIGYPAHALDDAAYAKWRKLAAGEDGGWLGALFNEVALRPAYGPDNPARPVTFTEQAPLFASPVYAFGAAAARALAASGWPHLCEAARGVVIPDLALVANRGRALSTAAPLSEDQALDFASAGLTPLVSRVNRDQAFFLKITAADGTPLGPRLFLSRVLGFFFRLRQAEDAPSGPELAAELTRRFATFFEKTGHTAPADAKVLEAGEAPAGARRLRVAFTPPPELNVGRARLEFDFLW